MLIIFFLIFFYYRPSCTPRPINMEDWNDQEKSLVSRLVPLYCDPTTEYSQLGSLFLTDTDTAIKQLFHFRELGNNLEPTFSSKSLLVFFVVYSILTCLNYGTAVPSGMFVPSLLQGNYYNSYYFKFYLFISIYIFIFLYLYLSIYIYLYNLNK